MYSTLAHNDLLDPRSLAGIGGNITINTSATNTTTVNSNTNVTGGLLASGAETFAGDVQSVAMRATGVGSTWTGAGVFGGTGAGSNAVIAGEIGTKAEIGGHRGDLAAWENLYINAGGGDVQIGSDASAPTNTLQVVGTEAVSGAVNLATGAGLTNNFGSGGTAVNDFGTSATINAFGYDAATNNIGISNSSAVVTNNIGNDVGNTGGSVTNNIGNMSFTDPVTTNIGTVGAGTINIGNTSGGNISIAVNSGTTNLVLNGIAQDLTTSNFLTLDGSNNVRYNTLANLIQGANGVLVTTSGGVATAQLGAANTDVQFSSDRYINALSHSLHITGAAQAEDFVINGSNGQVSIGTASPQFNQLFGNSTLNTVGSDGNGLEGTPGGMSWQGTGTGYVAGFYNAQASGGGNALEVKVADNSSSTYALDVSQNAAQATTGTPLFNVRGDGTVNIPGYLGIGTTANSSNALNILVTASETSTSGINLSATDYVGGTLPEAIVQNTTGLTWGTAGGNTEGRMLRFQDAASNFYDLGITQGGSFMLDNGDGINGQMMTANTLGNFTFTATSLSTNPVITIVNGGSGNDISGNGGSWSVTKAGAASFGSTGSFGGAVNMNSNQINNLADPTLGTDAANLNTVNNAVNAAVSGTVNTMAKFTGANAVGNSLLTDDGSFLNYNGGQFVVNASTGDVNLGRIFNLSGTRWMHNTGTNNDFVGLNAGNFSLTGTNDIALGPNVLQNLNTGSQNTGLGAYALVQTNSGSNNTAAGYNALNLVTSGSDNTAVGNSAGQAGTGVTMGSGNTLIGSNAQVDNSNAQDRTAIGYGATATADDEVQLGSGSVTLVNTSGDISAGSGKGFQINGAAVLGNYLRGDGTRFVSSAIQAGDIPTGSGNYIQNQSASAQTASFWINGSGQVSTFTAGSTVTLGNSNGVTNTMGNTGAGLATTTIGQATAVGGTTHVNIGGGLGTSVVTIGDATGTSTVKLGALTSNGVVQTSSGNGTLGIAAVNMGTEVTGTLGLTNGGTGANLTLTTGDLIDAASSSAMGNIADVATGSVLVSGGVGAAPSYSTTPTLGKVSTTTGTLSLANSGSAFAATLASSATLGQATTYTLTDPGAATANIIVSTSGSGQTIAGGLTSSGTLTASGTGGLALTNATQPTISLTDTKGVTITDGTNTLASVKDDGTNGHVVVTHSLGNGGTPDAGGVYVDNTIRAWGNIPAAGTAANSEFGVSSYTHTNGTGVYVLTLATALTSATSGVALITSLTDGTAVFASITAASTVTVHTFSNFTGTAADEPFYIEVVGR